MGNGNSPTGFGSLMTPMGLAILTISVLLLVALINFGSAWIKVGEAKARAERKELAKLKAEREELKRKGLS